MSSASPTPVYRAMPKAVAALALIGLYALVLLRTAWLQDDAFITFRTVHNASSGLGLTWNPAERVQVNVHPLWTGLLAALYAFTREIYYSSLVLSIGLSVLAFALVVAKLANSTRGALLAGCALISSKAFVDYSTGGLENPLTHLLLVAFALLYMRDQRGPRAPFLLSLVAGLLVLTRVDLIVLLAPALAFRIWGGGTRSTLAALAVGFAPVALWLTFATLYYGTPVPNPATAKVLGLGLPRSQLLGQGLIYFRDSLATDSITLGTVTIAILLAWRRCSSASATRVLTPLALGIALYLGYVLWIGGCFMAGRFFAAPLLLAVILLVRIESMLPAGAVWALVGGTALAGLAAPTPTVLAGASYDVPEVPSHGVVDCRGFYYQNTGLLSTGTRRWEYAVASASRCDPPLLAVLGAVGLDGFRGGPGFHVVDKLGLCDPLLARLPVVDPARWRVGHAAHHMPAGYLKSLRTGENRIEDPQLREYYARLCVLMRGPLFTWERMRTMAGFLSGRYDDLLASYVAGPYWSEVRQEIAMEDVAVLRPAGTPWYADELILLEAKLTVRLPAIERNRCVEIALDGNDRYLLIFLLGDEVRGGVDVPPLASGPEPGLRVHEVAVPEPAVASGYDRITLVPQAGDGIYALGHLRLLEAGGG